MNQAEKSIFSVVNLTDANKHLTDREKKARKSVNLNPISLKQVIDYINLQDVSPELKDVLRKKASRYPHQALQHFVDGFAKILATEQRKLGKGYVIPAQPKPASEAVVGHKPKRQYHAPEKVVIKAKKIAIEEIPVDEPLVAEVPLPTESQELEMRPAVDPFESEIPVPSQPVVQFTEIPAVKPPAMAVKPPVPVKPPAARPMSIPAPMQTPMPAPAPTPTSGTPQKVKFVPFSATLNPEDFE